MTPSASNAIAAIYACATEPGRWPETLQHIADCFGDVGGLLLHRREDGTIATVVSPSLRAASASYENVWWQHDIRAMRSLDYAYRDFAGALTDRHVVTEDEVATHPIYTEFLASFGLRWVASVQVSPQPRVQVGLSILRSTSKDRFSDEELAIMTDLGRHAEQSLRLGLRLMDAEVLNFGLGEALGRLAAGVFVLDEDSRIVFVNSKAQSLMETVFVGRNGVLSCRSPQHQKRLSTMLRTAGLAALTSNAAATSVSPLVIDANGSRFAVYVLPVPEGGSGLDPTAKPLNVVLVVDLAPGAPLDPSLVRDVYGLTLGESRVAALVGAGISPKETASKLSISELTVRSVLKRVFTKLEVSRQAELVELLVRLKTVETAR